MSIGIYFLARKRRCQQCHGCLAQDCGNCNNCKDKPKFGGPGRKKQCCIKRKCYGTNDDCGLPSPSVPLHVPPSIPMICLEDKGINFVCYE